MCPPFTVEFLCLNCSQSETYKGTVIIYQVEGLENFRGVNFFLYRYYGGQFLKRLSLGAVNLSLKHLVVKKKVKVKK